MNTTPAALFLNRFRTIFPQTALPDGTGRPLSIRVNRIRSGIDSVKRQLSDRLIPFRSVPWYGDALVLPESDSRSLTDLPLIRRGEAFIQSLSSMIPALVLAPAPQDRILDLAAAPGSKTSQLAALMGNSGEILANDIDRNRLYKLRAVLEILGVKNVKISSMAGQALWQKHPEEFDGVLLDAPCSMEGTKLYASVKKIRELAKLQRWLLRSAVSAARPGGTIVYSTCSMAPEENEEVIDWILDKERGKIELAPINLPVPEAVPGMAFWQGKELHPSLVKTVRIPPSALMEQFFIARIVKIESTVPAGTVQ